MCFGNLFSMSPPPVGLLYLKNVTVLRHLLDCSTKTLPVLSGSKVFSMMLAWILAHPVKTSSLCQAVMLLAALMAIPNFSDVRPLAGYLLLPYVGWTCFATTMINCSLSKGSAQVRHLPLLAVMVSAARTSHTYTDELKAQSHFLHFKL